MNQRPKVRKGRFIQRTSGLIIPFFINPASIRRSHGWSYGSRAVPLRSTPYYGGGAGRDFTLSFTLYYDGDRGRVEMRRSAAAAGGTINPFVTAVPAGVDPEMNMVRQLVRPHDASFDGSYGTPDQCILDLGRYFTGVVGVEEVGDETSVFLPELDSLFASMDVLVHVEEEYNTTDWLWISSETSNALTEMSQSLTFGES